MKKIRVILLFAAVSGALGVSAFTTVKKASTVDYHYTSNSTAEADILAGANYASGAASSCNGGSAMPCTVEFDDATYPTVQDWLNAEGSKANVINAAKTKKH